MNWIKNLQRVIQPKVIRTMNKQQIGVLADKFPQFQESGSAEGGIALSEIFVSERKLYQRSYGYRGFGANSQYYSSLSRKSEHAIQSSPNLGRDFLAKLWVADGKMKRNHEKRKRKFVEYVFKAEMVDDTSGSHGSYSSRKFVTEPLKTASDKEASVASLLSRSNLLITRDIEWANLTLGFEQANRYAIVDVSNPHEPAGFIREESNVIVRQLLRLRRPFVATITDGYGNELFRVRRPFWWITSSIYAEVGGKEIGVVHRRWHLWKRVYDLYLGDEQFAVVENPGFWNWTFTLTGVNGEVLAEIDRDWRGFGFEVFTDAGQYVIRFGSAAHDPATLAVSGKVKEFEVARPLTLSERAVTVALAVSLDNDYFSRHGGWGLPFIAVAE